MQQHLKNKFNSIQTLQIFKKSILSSLQDLQTVLTYKQECFQSKDQSFKDIAKQAYLLFINKQQGQSRKIAEAKYAHHLTNQKMFDRMIQKHIKKYQRMVEDIDDYFERDKAQLIDCDHCSKAFTQVGHERHIKNIEKQKITRKINKKRIKRTVRRDSSTSND